MIGGKNNNKKMHEPISVRAKSIIMHTMEYFFSLTRGQTPNKQGSTGSRQSTITGIPYCFCVSNQLWNGGCRHHGTRQEVANGAFRRMKYITRQALLGIAYGNIIDNIIRKCCLLECRRPHRQLLRTYYQPSYCANPDEQLLAS